MNPTDTIIITKHAQKRLKQRIGLPKTARVSHCQKAFDKGYKHSEAQGHAKRYIDKIFFNYRKANQIRVYGEFVYLFAGNILITILKLPHKMKGKFEK